MTPLLRFPVGQQRIIPTYGKHEGVKLLGCLNYETGRVYAEEHEKYDAKVFLGFLKNGLKEYPAGKIVMILDNAKIHRANLLRPFLEENQEQLSLVFLPPYSPNLRSYIQKRNASLLSPETNVKNAET